MSNYEVTYTKKLHGSKSNIQFFFYKFNLINLLLLILFEIFFENISMFNEIVDL